MTERGDFSFIGKEAADDRPWIAAKPAGRSLSSIHCHLGFELKSGTSHEEAKAVASFLNIHIEAITHTEI